MAFTLRLGFEDLTKLLIKRGARTTIIDNYQTTAAGWARARGNLKKNLSNEFFWLFQNGFFRTIT